MQVRVQFKKMLRLRRLNWRKVNEILLPVLKKRWDKNAQIAKSVQIKMPRWKRMLRYKLSVGK